MCQISEISQAIQGYKEHRNGPIIRNLDSLKAKYTCLKKGTDHFLLEDKVTKNKYYVTINGLGKYRVSTWPPYELR